MDDLSLPKRPIQIKKSLRSIRSAFKHDRTPVKEIPGIPQLALYDNPITPNIPIDPLFPSTSTTQATISSGEDISEIGTGTRFVGIEARDPSITGSLAGWITPESGSQCELIVAW